MAYAVRSDIGLHCGELKGDITRPTSCTPYRDPDFRRGLGESSSWWGTCGWWCTPAATASKPSSPGPAGRTPSTRTSSIAEGGQAFGSPHYAMDRRWW